jgi:hypothetical protein
MRCYFIKNGHVAGLRELPDLSDQEAIDQSKLLFKEQPGAYDTFEVWERARVVYLHTPPNSKAESKSDWLTL